MRDTRVCVSGDLDMWSRLAGQEAPFETLPKHGLEISEPLPGGRAQFGLLLVACRQPLQSTLPDLLRVGLPGRAFVRPQS